MLILGTNSSEFIPGSPSNDTMYGYAGNDIIGGRGGNDYIDGGTGGDNLHGGAGNNTLVGGAGNDKLFSTFDDLLGNYTKGLTSGAGIRDVLIGGANSDEFYLYGDGANFFSYYDSQGAFPGATNGAFAGTNGDSFANVKDLQIGESVFFTSNIYNLAIENFGTSVRIGYDYPGGAVDSVDDLIAVLDGVQVGNLSINPLNLTTNNTFYTVTRTS